MNNSLYIVWKLNDCSSIVFEVKLYELTPNECKNWLFIHNKYSSDEISKMDKELIEQLKQELWNFPKYKKLKSSFFEILGDYEKISGLFIFTGE